jgi:hypothetical protein
MQRRRLITPRVVGMAMLLMATTSWGVFANDGTSSTGNAPAAPAASTANPGTTDQITLLKRQMALQQQQIEQMQKALAEQNRLLEELSKPATPAVQAAQPATPAPATQTVSQQHSTSLGDVASTTPVIPQQQNKADNSIAPAGSGGIWMGPSGNGDDSSPLQIHIGDATLTPVGFMDFTSVYRNHDTNGSIATNFGNIPYASTTAYAPNLSEFRLSTENSRIGFRADAMVHGLHVMGYMEADFHGNNAASVAVSTDSNTLRERLYWVDLNSGHFELLGGQTWSLATPGRSGISPLPADIFYSQDTDVNYQAGLVFGRIPELRFVWHPSKKVAWAFALDSPDQYAGGNGGAGNIVLPALLNTSSTYQGELDYNAGNTLSTPNVFPDFITKLAFDPSKHIHVEIMGMERNFKVYDTLTTTYYSKEGGGVAFNASVEVLKGLRLLTNDFWSDGGGRYIYGQVPDLVAHADGSISLIHASSTVSGLEFTAKKSMLYAYYGGIYAQKNTAYDSNGTTLIGYGMESGPDATNAQNRNVQEITFGFNQTMWKNPKYGAVNFMGQYSYLLRDPWYEKPGVAPNANVNMLFFNLRYTLPGSAPTMGR